MKSYFVYILASEKNGTLYVGITSDLIKRIYEHKTEAVEGFTQKYQIKRLVYFEELNNPDEAILREKRLKRWKRQWKVELIEAKNPEWKDLYGSLLSQG